MKKILFSWLAVVNDFKPAPGNQIIINESGPNVGMHAFHWDYDFHLLLHTPNYRRHAVKLAEYLKLQFAYSKVFLKEFYIQDVYNNLKDIKNSMENLVLQYSDYQMDFLLSTGTGMMKIAWYILHTSLPLKSRMLIILPPRESKEPFMPDLKIVDVEKSKIPYSAVLREENTKHFHSNFFVTSSLKGVYDKARKLAQTDVSALILGNTGTGKEMLARYIHQNSARADKPFMALNCSAFSDQLLESRLFGHKKGSFTGANSDHKGIFEQADGGTVFLDEIGHISPYMQQLLLRFLQEKEIQPIGGKTKKVDVRIIAATNADIPKLIEQQKFRLDLFYRLAVTLKLPDFKEFTKDEKIEWFNFFIKQKQKEFHLQNPLKLDKKLLHFLLDYAFPGNFRELINIIENLYIFSGKTAKIDDLPYQMEHSPQNTSLLLDDVEKNHIIYVLKKFNFNKTRTAKALGISLNGLKNKMARYNISDIG